MGKGKKKFRKSKQGKGSGSLVSRAKQMRKMHVEHQQKQKKHQRWSDEQASRKRDRRRKNAFVPYADQDFILLVGEGNFSFARALARRFGGLGTRIVATSYDTREEVLSKYPDVAGILEELDTAGVTVVHGVDGTALETNKDLRAAIATTMYIENSSSSIKQSENRNNKQNNVDQEETRESKLDSRGSLQSENNDASEITTSTREDTESSSVDGQSSRRYRNRIDVFDKVVFNFPHTGCGIKDTLENNRVHQRFLTDFFNSALNMLRTVDASDDNKQTVADKDAKPSPLKDNYDEHRGDIQFVGKKVSTSSGSRSSSKKRKSSSKPAAFQTPVRQNLPQIHVTLKTGEPYNSWQVPRMAKLTGKLRMKTAIDFYPEMYSGYEHRRTVGAYRSKGNGMEAAANKDIKRSLKQDEVVASRTYIFEPPRTREEYAAIARHKKLKHQRRVMMGRGKR